MSFNHFPFLFIQGAWFQQGFSRDMKRPYVRDHSGYPECPFFIITQMKFLSYLLYCFTYSLVMTSSVWKSCLNRGGNVFEYPILCLFKQCLYLIRFLFKDSFYCLTIENGLITSLLFCKIKRLVSGLDQPFTFRGIFRKCGYPDTNSYVDSFFS